MSLLDDFRLEDASNLYVKQLVREAKNSIEELSLIIWFDRLAKPVELPDAATE